MKFLWIGLCSVAALMCGCGPTPVSRERQKANAEHFDLAAADRLLAREAQAALEEDSDRETPAEDELVVNENVRLLPEGTGSAEKPESAVSSSPEPLPDTPTDKGIQRALKDLGFYEGAIDGKVGPKTLAAIKSFQAEKGLKIDGKVGPKTWSALKRAVENHP